MEDLVICSNCNDYCLGFMEFYRKSRSVSEMFEEFLKREVISEEEVLYAKNMFQELGSEIELIENAVDDAEIIEDEAIIIETLNFDLNEEEVNAIEEHKLEDYNFTCHECDPVRSFSEMNSLSAHCHSEHNCLPEVNCPECDKTLHTVKAVTHHCELHYQNKSFKFKCERCRKFYKTEAHYKNHVKVCLTSDASIRKFSCEICMKSFKENRHLSVHMNTHLPDEKKYTNNCKICDKNYSSVFSLRQHIKVVHINHARFKCQYCPKEFSRKANLDSHHITHSDIKLYECEICLLKLKTKANLRVHKKLHSTDPNDLVECKVCHKQFKTSNQLTNHMITHDKVKKFACRHCENVSYKRSKELQSHMLAVHLNIRKYSCKWCSRSFVSNSNFRKHKRTAHPVQLEEFEKNLKSEEINFDEAAEEIFILEETE